VDVSGEERTSPFDLTVAERAALAELREVREAIGYEDHPVDDPARASAYISALEARVIAHYVTLDEIRELRRREEEGGGGALYWVGYLIVALLLGVWILALIWLGRELVNALL